MTRSALVARIGRGLAVDTALGVVVRIVSLAVTVAVARTLTQAEFGTVSLVLAIFGIAETLTNLSLETALARRATLTDEVVNVAWTLSVLRALLLTLAIYAAAPLLKSFWEGGDELVRYLRIMALGTAGAGLSNAHAVRFQRELRFEVSLLVGNARALLGALASLILLVASRDAIALVLGPVIGNFLHSGLTWLLIAPRPRPQWSVAIVREFVEFGRWLLGHSIFVYLLFTLDNLFVGRVLGPAALGAYSLGWRITNTAMTFLTRSLAGMLVPAYASLASDPSAVRHAVLRALGAAGAFGAFASAILCLFAHEILTVIGGSQTAWSEAAPVMQALTPFAFTRITNNVVAPMFHAAGEPKPLALISGLQLVLLLPALWLGARWGGLTGVAAGVSLVTLVGASLVSLVAQRRFGLTLRSQGAALAPAVVVAPAAALLVWALMAPLQSPVLRLVCGALLLGTTFLALWEGGRRVLPHSKAYPSLLEPVAAVLRLRQREKAS